METKKRPLILISNDDGYQAKGINCLIDMIRHLGDIVVCAPDGPRSGYSCAFSAEIPLRLTLQRQEEGLEVWSSNGTPVDCVKLALAKIVDRRPDIVIGGINHGDNGSVNSHYSGTMGVVMEGCMKYIPSVAFSLCDHRPDADFEPLRPYVEKYTRYALEKGLPKGVCLNINFPLISNLAPRSSHLELQGRSRLPYGSRLVAERGNHLPSSSWLRLPLDGGPLPERRARGRGYRQLGTCPRLRCHHPNHLRRYCP